MIPERLVDAFLDRSNSNPPEKEKSLGELLANSTVVAALLTVIGTALATWVVAGPIQDRSKKNELDLQAKRDYLRSQAEIDVKSMDIAGRYISVLDDLLDTKHPDWADNRVSDPVRKEENRKSKKEIRELYNQEDRGWRRAKQTTGYLLDYYHQDRPAGSSAIGGAWKELVQSLDRFAECAQTEAQKPGTGIDLCKTPKGAAEAALDHLSKQLASQRTTFWSPTNSEQH